MEASHPESQTHYAQIIAFIPGWLEARRQAERDAHMNRFLNQQERDAFAPINRLLDEIIELRLGDGGGSDGS
jgi:hypothetical protein